MSLSLCLSTLTHRGQLTDAENHCNCKMAEYNNDPEKNDSHVITRTSTTIVGGEGKTIEKHRVTDKVDDLAQVEASKGWFRSVLKYASFLHAEERGIERVREEDRVKQSVLDGYTMWASANFT